MKHVNEISVNNAQLLNGLFETQFLILMCVGPCIIVITEE